MYHLHFSNAIEEELDEGIEQEAGQEIGISVCLAMDVGSQEQCSRDDGHKCHLFTKAWLSITWHRQQTLQLRSVL